MSKKPSSLFLVFCMIFCLSACGTTEKSSNAINIPSESQSDSTQNINESTQTELENNEVLSNIDGLKENDIAQSQPSTSQSKPTNTTNRPTHIHSYLDATCTAPEKCSCGATQGYALGHKYQNGVCYVCNAVDKEKILLEIEEKTTDLANFKSMLNNEESLLSTFEVSLKMYQDELDDAVIKLEKAKSQKTMRVYYENIGWVWEADPQRVALAQDDVDHYTYMVNSQQSLVDSCNKEIKKYKKLIEETEMEIKELKNKL